MLGVSLTANLRLNLYSAVTTQNITVTATVSVVTATVLVVTATVSAVDCV